MPTSQSEALPPLRLAGDARVLLQLLRGMPAGADAAHRLERFYAPQAASYDDFRRRLLRGRAELIADLALPGRADVVELGAGTGCNLEFFGARLADLNSMRLVDLCPSLLEQARLRSHAMPNVQVLTADACSYQPPAPVDCVIFSYSLTMIPDWRAALANAVGMLRQGGKLAVVDFTLPSKRGPGSRALRGFWHHWFSHDGVQLDEAHIDVLQAALPQHRLSVACAPVPYLPMLKVPYYRFVGIKD